MSTLPSPIVWVKWTTTAGGTDVGAVERLPRPIALVYIERGDAVEVNESEVPAAVRRRGGTAA